jgi:hypothetical protein
VIDEGATAPDFTLEDQDGKPVTLSELRGWLAEAYEVGMQRHVTDPAWEKVRVPEAAPRSP